MNRKFLILMVLLCLLVGGVGATVTTFYIPTNKSDGYISLAKTDSAASWSLDISGMRSATTGTQTSSAATTSPSQIRGNATTNYFNNTIKTFLIWDTSAIPDIDIIDSAIVGIYGSSKQNELGAGNLEIVNFSPSNYPVLVADYNNTDFTKLSDSNISYASFSSTGYNNYTMNTAGLAQISKTANTSVLLMTAWETNNNIGGMTWVGNGVSSFLVEMYDRGLSSGKIAFIEVTHHDASILPVASFTSNATYGLHPSIQFNDTSTNTPTQWNWSWGDSSWTNGTTQNATHTYTTNGTYDVSLIATNSAGSDTETKTDYIYSYGVTHPRAIDVLQSPGYLNRTIAPWSTRETSIRNYAVTGLGYSYSPPSGRTAANNALRALDMSIIYLIDNNTDYANKTVEALLYAWDDFTPSRYTTASRDYTLAYDNVWKTHGVNSTLDNTNISIIQNQLAQINNWTYYDAISDTDSILDELPSYTYVGISAGILEDCPNTSLLSTPVDLSLWKRMGREELFVNDTLHTRSAAYNETNSGYFGNGIINTYDGRSVAGSYNGYYEVDIFVWAQIYKNMYGENLLETYPALKKFVMEPVWSSLPNFYSSNVNTYKMNRDDATRLAYSLLDATNRSYLRRQTESQFVANEITQSNGNHITSVSGYMFIGNYSSEAYATPTQKNSLDAKYNYQTIRTGWTKTSDFLQLVTWNQLFMREAVGPDHQDQLAFEYYSRGNLLMPDASEPSYYYPFSHPTTPNDYYGRDTAFHNSFMIENGYGRGNISNVTGRGIQKNILYTQDAPTVNATVRTIIQTPSVIFINANSTINRVAIATTGFADSQGSALSPVVEYSRGVLYPLGDYPVIIDRANSTSAYGYNIILRLGSLDYNVPTLDGGMYYNSSGAGNVTGDLSIEGSGVAWKDNPVLAEVEPATQMNYLDWNTTNPYGDPVRFRIFTAPRTPFSYQRFLTRFGGQRGASPYGATEASNPQVYLKQPANNTLYRVTALLSRYDNETPRTPSELTVTGTGSAIKVISADGTKTDTIYTGTGNSTFNSFTTDADTAFIRKGTTVTDYTLINATGLYEGATRLFNSTQPLNYVSYNKSTITTVNVSGTGVTNLTFYTSTPTYVKVDGVPITTWFMRDSSTLDVYTTLSDHGIEFDGGEPIAPVASFTPTGTTTGVTPLSVSFTDTSTNTPTIWVWNATNVAGNNTPFTFNVTQNPTQVFTTGNYTIKLNATNAAGSNISAQTTWINVTNEYSDWVYSAITGAWSRSSASYTILRWNATGTRNWTTPAGVSTVDYLVVAAGGSAGGSGGYSGGGGGGGFRNGSLAVSGNISVTTGTYGTKQGGNSSFGSIVSNGGGWGSDYLTAGGYGGSGGASGAGEATYGGLAGWGTAGQGYNGSRGDPRGGAPDWNYYSGGGGGAGQLGSSCWFGTCKGGYGLWSDISGTNTQYSGGGGGVPVGAGGAGGGGRGGGQTSNGLPGTNETGGGAGGSGLTTVKFGGTGIVYIKYITPGSIPTASFTATNVSVATNITTTSLTGYNPFIVQFTDTSVGFNGTPSHVWNMTVLSNSTFITFNQTSSVPLYTFNDVGNYSIKLNVTNIYASNTSVQTMWVNLSAAPLVITTFTPTGVTTGYTSKTVTFTDTSTGTPTAWTWTYQGIVAGNNTAKIFSVVQNPVASFDIGNYSITLASSNAFGFGNTSAQSSWVNVSGSAPVANFIATPLSGVIPLAVQFFDNSTNTSTVWDWGFGDGTANSTLQNPVHTYTATGTYTVFFNASNAYGYGNTQKVGYITVGNTLSDLTFTGIGSNGLLYGNAPFTVQFNGSVSGASPTYAWNFTNGGNVVQNITLNPAYTYTAAGTYSVNFTANNTGSTQNLTRTDYVKVLAIGAPYAQFTGNPLSGSPGLLVSFTDASLLGTSTSRVCNWSFGDSFSTAPYSAICGNVQHVYSYGGVYDVNYTITNANGTSSLVRSQYITTSVNQNAQNTWWTPHTVQVTVMDTYGARLPNVQIVSYYNQSSIPTSWINELYGIQTGPMGDMVNKTLSMQGTTGSDGTITFTMLGSLKYDFYLTSATDGLNNYYVSAFPSDSMLNIYVIPLGVHIPTSINSTYTALNQTRVYFTEPDIYNVSMCIDYKDNTGLTTTVTDTWMFANNNSVISTVSFVPWTNLNTNCYTMPNIRGTQVWWGYNATRVI